MKRSLILPLAILVLAMVPAILASSSSETSTSHQVKSFVPAHIATVERRHVRRNAPSQSGLSRKSIHPKVAAASGALSSFRFLAAGQLGAGASGYYTGVVGDYNNDGKKDVATIVSSDFGSNFSLSVMLGNGDGTFGTARLTSIAFSSTERVYSADLNKDGRDDIVIVHAGSMDVFISNGDGTFAAPGNYPDGVGIPAAVLLADLNADTNVDIIVTDGVGQPDNPLSVPMVSLLRGNGDGTFQASTQTALPGQLPNGVFADVDRDGNLDLVGATQVFFGSSLGLFSAPVTLVATNGQPNSCAVMDGAVAVADVDDDLLADIVTADCQNDTVTVYLNGGGQTFQTGVSYFAGYYPQGVAVADVNADSAPDIIVSNADSSNITVLQNLAGMGTFQAPESGYALGGFGWLKPLIADFDGDLQPDVVVASYVPEFQFTLNFLHGFADGSFSAAADYFAKPSPGSFVYGTGIATADFNNDGRADFVRGNASNSGAGITIFLTSPNSALQSGLNIGSGDYNYVKTGDFDGDSNQDIVAIDEAGSVALFLGNGDGTFQAPQSFAGLAVPAEGLVVGDFNHDGESDVAVTGSGAVAVLLNNNSGGFALPVTYAITSSGVGMAAADINGDGNLDLVVPLAYSNLASVLTGKNNGTFQASADVDLGFSFPQSIAIGDFNGDGKPDLAVTIDDFSAAMGMDIVLGNGDGTFQPGKLYPSSNLSSAIGPGFPGGVQAVDLDKDGNLDLVYDNSEYENIAVMFGRGDGTFLSPAETPVGGYPLELVVADVDGDGSEDVITSMGSFAGITVLLSTSGSSIVVQPSINPADPGATFVLTATVASTGHHVRSTPTGTVTFSEGATTLGTSSLSGGTTTLAMSESLSGDHTIRATYSGDPTFLGQAVDFVETINVGGVSAADFALSADSTSAMLQAGQSASFTIIVIPTNGFNSLVSFNCGTLPPGVTCQFTPTAVTPTNGPAQVQLVVTAETARIAGLQSRHTLSFLCSMALGFVSLIFVDSHGRKRNPAGMTALVLAGLVIMTSTVGCGGNTSARNPHMASLHKLQVVASAPGTEKTLSLNIMY
jgi:hypothetical protein